MNAYENFTENPVVVAKAVMLMGDAYPSARYKLESAAAVIASLDREFRMELAGRLREAKTHIVQDMLRR